MKNINQKTLIFYTFQQNPQSQYNVTTLKNQISQPKIKDILYHLPIDLSSSKYHFRFKSECSEGDQKIAGWIDIMNLMAKVPFYNNSIYVKILKLTNTDSSKIFSREKLERVGLVAMSQNGNLVHNNNFNLDKKNLSPNNNQPHLHHSNSLDPRGKQIKEKHPVKINNYPKPKTIVTGVQQDFGIKQVSNKSNAGSSKLIDDQLIMEDNKSQGVKRHMPNKSGSLLEFGDNFPMNSNTKSQKSQSDKVKQTGQALNSNKKKAPPPQSPQVLLARIKQIHQHQQQAKRLELLARDELQDTINNWGYSGKKIINNLTTLLATLHEIWPVWTAISLGDLQSQQQVLAIYKKAAISTHPDKNRKKDYKTKYLSKRIFQLLNQAKKCYKN